MRAIVYKKFGPPDVLELEEIEKPVPEDHEVLIRIQAATVAAEDPGMRSSPGLNGWRKPKRSILGFYLSGVVEATGKDVTRLKKGDEVYGNTGLGLLGTYVEYKCMPEQAALVSKPTHITCEEAAAIPNGVLTTLPFLQENGNIQKGHNVLIFRSGRNCGGTACQVLWSESNWGM